MKKVTMIIAMAAFVFGVQPQEAFSSETNILAMEEAPGGQARIGYDDRSEILTLHLATAGDEERALVQVVSNGNLVVKEVFLVSGRAQKFEIDMSGMPTGTYSVKVSAPSFKEGSRFKKK